MRTKEEVTEELAVEIMATEFDLGGVGIRQARLNAIKRIAWFREKKGFPAAQYRVEYQRSRRAAEAVVKRLKELGVAKL